ncbi:MAG: hypothetical protein J7L15_02460 [Clostridiales bacterium]|nr:hypothetical protein [Clostridiales bacterium]
MTKFKELFEKSQTCNKLSKQEMLDNAKKDPYVITNKIKKLLKNKVEFTVEMGNCDTIKFGQAGNRSWRGEPLNKQRSLTYGDNIPRTANEQLEHLAQIGFITGICKIIKVDNKPI